MSEYTIGVGVITYNRPDSLRKLVDSLPRDIIDQLVIINDGDFNETIDHFREDVISTTNGVGVGSAKNMALRNLMSQDVDHIFLIEDDVYIKDPNVFSKYIEAAKTANYQHMNYSQHGILNKDEFGNNTPKLSVKFTDDITIDYHGNCVGAFSYYTKEYIDTVGYINEQYFNAVEHISHTYSGVVAGLHPPFWYFADIASSEDYIGECVPWSSQQSIIFSNFNVRENFEKGLEIFEAEHQCKLLDVVDIDNLEAMKIIKEIYNSK